MDAAETTSSGVAVIPEVGKDEAQEKVVPEGFVNVAEQDSSAYLANYRAHKTGISYDEMVQSYSDWANNYDAVSTYQYYVINIMPH